jgi:hypothetical protein
MSGGGVSTMKIHRLFPLFLALAGLTGCPDEPCFGGGVSVSQQQPGVILVGGETILRVAPNLSFGCESGEEVPTPASFTVEVYDADNQPVENHASLARPSTGLSTISFTPSKPGRHHIFAAFDPVGGIQQFDLFAAMNHENEAQALTVRQSCTSLARTTKGALVCDQDVIRDGAYVQRFTNSMLAVAGDVVWVVNNARVQRYVDSGTALTLSQSLENGMGTPEFLHATENELVVLYSSIIQRFTVSGTGLFTTGTAVWTPSNIPLSSAAGSRVMAVRTGDRLGIVTRITAGTTITSGYQVCPYRLEGGRFVRSPEPCTSFSGTLVGYEPDALWVGDPQRFSEVDFTALRYAQWTATGLAEQASLPLGFNFKVRLNPLYGRQSAVPIITSSSSSVSLNTLTTLAVYSAERRAILMEYLGPQLYEGSASRQLYWASQSSGPVTSGLPVLVRPSAL